MILAPGTQVDVTSPGAPVIKMQPPSPQSVVTVPIGRQGPAGADGAPGGSDAATAGWVTSGTLTGAALSAKIAAALAAGDYATAAALASGLSGKASTTALADETSARIAAMADEVARANAAYIPSGSLMFIPAKAFDPADGAACNWASLDSGKRWGWMLDSTVVEGVTTLFRVPPGIVKVTVDVVFAPISTAGGNVAFNGNLYNATAGEGASSNGGGITSAASAAGATANTLRFGALSTQLTTDPAKYQRLSVYRNATSGTDTHESNDIAFLGVLLHLLTS